MKNISETLVIKNFPTGLSNDDKTNFLYKCGATDVRILSSKRNRHHVAFAKFPTANLAERVLRELHQQDVMGSLLTVEFAKCKEEQSGTFDVVLPAKPWVNFQNETGSEMILKHFLEKLNSWTSNSDLRSPVPCHLKYHYPPPTKATLKNICHQMSSVPRFYTQVLHLMNKMNLPCPFSLDDPNLEESQEIQPTYEIAGELSKRIADEVDTDEESELSSEEEKKETLPIKLPVKATKISRTILVKKIIPTPNQKAKKHKFEDVFEDPTTFEVPKPKIKKLSIEATEAEARKVSPRSPTGFGLMFPVPKPTDPPPVSTEPIRNEMEEERLEKEVLNCITSEALLANRIPEKDRAVLPVYKNYAEGAPTCRLYVKNLAKQTTVEDLKFIYYKYRTDTETTPNIFDIRLMQEGRMKGQAFITLQSVELAKMALAETNGYILNDKPLVVAFARSAVKKPD